MPLGCPRRKQASPPSFPKCMGQLMDCTPAWAWLTRMSPGTSQAFTPRWPMGPQPGGMCTLPAPAPGWRCRTPQPPQLLCKGPYILGGPMASSVATARTLAPLPTQPSAPLGWVPALPPICSPPGSTYSPKRASNRYCPLTRTLAPLCSRGPLDQAAELQDAPRAGTPAEPRAIVRIARKRSG